MAIGGKRRDQLVDGLTILTSPGKRLKLLDMTDSLSAILAALSDPTRRAVVEQLIHGQASVTELHAPHKLALPTFMRHLKVLEDCGLIRSIKRGRIRTCQISMAPILEVQGWLAWQTTLRESREE